MRARISAFEMEMHPKIPATSSSVALYLRDAVGTLAIRTPTPLLFRNSAAGIRSRGRDSVISLAPAYRSGNSQKCECHKYTFRKISLSRVEDLTSEKYQIAGTLGGFLKFVFFIEYLN